MCEELGPTVQDVVSNKLWPDRNQEKRTTDAEQVECRYHRMFVLWLWTQGAVLVGRGSTYIFTTFLLVVLRRGGY